MYKEDLRIIQLLNRRNRTSSMLRASAGGGWNALRGSGINLHTICSYLVYMSTFKYIYACVYICLYEYIYVYVLEGIGSGCNELEVSGINQWLLHNFIVQLLFLFVYFILPPLD